MINIIKWEPSKVTMAQLFIGDPVEKVKDAIANTNDTDLLAAYGAVNRLISGIVELPSDEVEHLRTEKILMENALTIRLRAARAAA